MLTVLSGGTGTPKLIQGLKEIVKQEDLAVVVNTAEDGWLAHGYFSPDVDTVLYTLCGIVDDTVWHGIKGDTYRTHERLIAMGYEEILKIGDRDRATHIQRCDLILKGKKLSEAIAVQGHALGVKARVYPMSDDPVTTVIATEDGEMSLHEFLIARKSKPAVKDVYLKGLDKARACAGAVAAIEESDSIIIGPSNPISSIMPILSLKGIKRALKKRRDECIAVSPLVSSRTFSGPAEIFMRAKGLKVESKTLAEMYKEYISTLIVHREDAGFDFTGVKCLKTNTIMNTLVDKKRLASFVIDSLGLK